MKYFWIIAGFLSLGLGVLGIFLPLLPTVPFLLLTTYCFARGSKKFHNWFIHTGIYKKYMLSYTSRRAMSWKEKLGILIPTILILLLGIALVKNVYARIIMLMVIAGHLIYFCFIVKLKKD